MTLHPPRSYPLQMKPIIAIIGRPNVGKSTLFNLLTNSKDALVADRPGVTRDRKIANTEYQGRPYLLIDTAGLGEINPDNEAMIEEVEKQSLMAVTDATAVIWVVDARDGLTTADEKLAQQLRAHQDKVFLAVNKAEGLDKEMVIAEFFALGMNQPYAVSAQRGSGVEKMMQAVFKDLPESDEEEINPDTLKIGVIGRPNVGKSTLINRLIGEQRLVTFDHPGTTRDSISITHTRNDKQYMFIDTAGIRRKSRVHDSVEKFSIIKSLQTIAEANIVLMVFDASEAITDQDLNLLGLCYDQGKAFMILLNKWDGIEQDQRQMIQDQVERKLSFIQSPIIRTISALHGSGVGNLYKDIDRIDNLLKTEMPTSEITQILQKAMEAHQPPLVRGRRIKLRYAHIGGHNPIRIIIHGNQTASVPNDYTRYLANFFQRHLRLEGIPVLIEYKYGNNPYSGKKNTLSKRQQDKRRRLMKFVKKNK